MKDRPLLPRPPCKLEFEPDPVTPLVKEVRKATDWSVSEMAAFFGTDRQAIYMLKSQNGNRITMCQWYKLYCRNKRVFDENIT